MECMQVVVGPWANGGPWTSAIRRHTRPSRRFPPEVLGDAEVAALLNACGNSDATHLRNRALIAILYRAGLRIAEALV